MSLVGNTLFLSSLDSTSGIKFGGDSFFDTAGAAVALAGDVNGDGLDDLIVSQTFADTSADDTGAVYVIFGRVDGFSSIPPVPELSTYVNGTTGFAMAGVAPYDVTGVSVSSIGDFNGDGFADLVIGAYRADANGANSGSAYIVFGHAGPFDASLPLADLDGTNGFTLTGALAGDRAGATVSSAGDLNGDGLDDVVVTSVPITPSASNLAAAYVVFGTTGALSASLDLADLDGTQGFKISGSVFNSETVTSIQRREVSVAAAGDLNGDGRDDLALGIRTTDSNGSDSGSAYVIFGRSGGFGANLDLTSIDGSNGFLIRGEAAGDLAGSAIANAGDVNGDGFDDLIVGAYRADPNGSNSGAAYVIFGRNGGFGAEVDLGELDGTNGFQVSGAATNDWAGADVSAAGDVNGDGVDDFLVFSEFNFDQVCAAYVVYGRTDGFAANLDLSTIDGTNGFRIQGETTGYALSAMTFSAAGDVNGDGFDDILIGDPVADEVGAAYIVYGFGAPASDDLITGTSADETLEGLAGNDTIIGGGGNDLLDGATGNDILDATGSTTARLFGGEGDDLLLTGQSAGQINGGVGNDVLRAVAATNLAGVTLTQLEILETAGFVVTAGVAQFEAFQKITYFDSPDFDEEPVRLVLSGSGILDIADELGGRSVSITASGLANMLTTGAGNDTLVGAAGADTLAGGLGDDQYEIGAGDTVIENSREGRDTVLSSISFTLGQNLENLVLVAGAEINGTGNGLANRITGNSFKNLLDGGGGRDTLVGGANNDTYVADLDDTIIENAGGGRDTVQVLVSYTLGLNLENLNLMGAGLIDGTGNALDNMINGNGARNVLSGGDGADRLDGGGDADTLIGGLGNDIYFDPYGDTLIENAGEGIDLVDTRFSYTLPENIENLNMRSGALNGFGNSLDNEIDGNSGNNWLEGRGGRDTIRGRSGNDTYVIDGDDVIIEYGEGGSDIVYSSGSYTLASNVEGLVLQGSSNSNGTGNALNNYITGDFWDNILDGRGGADVLSGGQGDDTFIVDDVLDKVRDLSADVSLYSGNDTVRSSVSFVLSENVENLVLTGLAAINGTGNGSSNRITGNDANNILTAGGAGDLVEGGLGDDTLAGGAGRDWLEGGLGNDTYIDDAVNGFLELVDEGTDTVKSDSSFALGANFENLELTGTNSVNGTGNALDNRIDGNDGDNILDGRGGNDSLNAGFGNDSLYGGLGDDRISAFYGNDLIEDQGGNDSISASNGADVINLSGGNDTVDSGSGNDRIDASAMTGFTLDAGADNDRVSLAFAAGATGSGTINGGSGFDILHVAGGDLAQAGVITGFEMLETLGETVRLTAGQLGQFQSILQDADTPTATLRVAIDLVGGGAADLSGVVGAGGVDLRVMASGSGGTAPGATITAGIGNDSLTGGAGDDTILGGGGVDWIGGGQGNDRLRLGGDGGTVIGGLGDDTLIGGDGADSLSGGDGNDLVTVNPNGFAGGLDTAAGGAGIDTVVLKGLRSDYAFTGTVLDFTASYIGAGSGGNAALSGFEYVRFDDQTVTVAALFPAANRAPVIISNGGGAVAAVSNPENLSVVLSVIATDADANSVIFYSIAGGADAARFAIDPASGQLRFVVPPNFEAPGDVGADNRYEVIVRASDGVAFDDQSLTVIITNALGVTINGSPNSDVIDTFTTVPGQPLATDEADLIFGGAGNDRLDGGPSFSGFDPPDTLAGGIGNDVYVVRGPTVIVENPGEGIDTVNAAVSYTLGAEVENLTLTGTANIDGTGNAGNNVLIGNAGDNILDGKAGVDRMEGGLGNDTYIVSDLGDGAFEAPAGGNDTVRASISFTLSLNIESLVLTGSANLDGSGNDLDNTITGNSGNNRLFGGNGADTLIGGRGNDTYQVDQIGDVVVELADEGIDLVESNVSYSLAGTAVENLRLSVFSAALNATGNALANSLVGNDNANVIDGGGGLDTLNGGGGNDTYVTDGDDVIIDNFGTELVLSSASFTLSGGLENLTLTGSADLNGTGNIAPNRLTGNRGNNLLDGAGGADTLAGGKGDDVYVVDPFDTVTEAAGEGRDRVESAGNFQLGANLEDLVLTTGQTGTGNVLANAITGNGAGNRLDGLLGQDTLTGGGGADRFIFSTVLGAGNADVITDFNAADDQIALSATVFSALSLGFLGQTAFASNTTGEAGRASDRIIYQTSTGELYYDSDGTGGTQKVLFATLTAGLTLSAGDFEVF